MLGEYLAFDWKRREVAAATRADDFACKCLSCISDLAGNRSVVPVWVQVTNGPIRAVFGFTSAFDCGQPSFWTIALRMRGSERRKHTERGWIPHTSKQKRPIQIEKRFQPRAHRIAYSTTCRCAYEGSGRHHYFFSDPNAIQALNTTFSTTGRFCSLTSGAERLGTFSHKYTPSNKTP